MRRGFIFVPKIGNLGEPAPLRWTPRELEQYDKGDYTSANSQDSYWDGRPTKSSLGGHLDSSNTGQNAEDAWFVTHVEAID